MSTSLLNCEILLSKEMGDYFASSTTTAGDAGGLNLIDTALAEKEDGWITDTCYDMIVSGTGSAPDEQERKIKSLVNESGTLGLVRAHTVQVPTTTAYRIHRLFSASEKRRALVHAAKAGFPYIHKPVRDESLTVENWLRDGDLEYNWTASTTNTYWKSSAGPTMTKYTTAPFYYRGATSCRLTGSTGYFYQSDTENPALQDLAGQSVTFKAKTWCNAASSLRLGILYDGTNLEYSSFHVGNSEPAWLSVTKAIDASPSAVSFRAYYTTGATAYVDDFRVYGPTRDKLYIGDLGLAQNYPHQVRQSADSNINDEPWQILRNYEIGSGGYIYLPEGSQNYRLRIQGIGYLDFYDTAGAVGTDWDDTIAIDSPQTEILVAEAAIYLCNQMIVPSEKAATTTRWERALAYWQRELDKRQRKYGMTTPSATIHWGVS